MRVPEVCGHRRQFPRRVRQPLLDKSPFSRKGSLHSGSPKHRISTIQVVEAVQEIDRAVPLSLHFAVEYQKGMTSVTGCLLLCGVLIVVLQGSAQKFAEVESSIAATT